MLLKYLFVTPARLFHRDGFVVVNNALPADETVKLKTSCDNLIEQVMEKDPLRLGNRGKDNRLSYFIRLLA